jgi:hypothetical protein
MIPVANDKVFRFGCTGPDKGFYYVRAVAVFGHHGKGYGGSRCRHMLNCTIIGAILAGKPCCIKGKPVSIAVSLDNYFMVDNRRVCGIPQYSSGYMNRYSLGGKGKCKSQQGNKERENVFHSTFFIKQ